MKKAIVAILALGLFGTTAMAQNDPKAKAILAEVSKTYRSYKSLKTDFTFVLNNQQAKVKETQKGTLFLKGPKYKVAMTNQELISNGTVQWTYLKADKEVQVSNVDNSGEALNPAKIFTIYEKGFKYLYVGDKTVAGKAVQQIELSPTDTKKSVFKIKLDVDKAKKQIASATIYEKNGNTYTYSVTNFAPNFAIADASFTFDAKKYPGVEVVDLR